MTHCDFSVKLVREDNKRTVKHAGRGSKAC